MSQPSNPQLIVRDSPEPKRLGTTNGSQRRATRRWLRQMRKCFAHLASIRDGSVEKLLLIQPILATVLYEVAATDNLLARRRRFAIERGKRDPQTFVLVIRELARQREHLRFVQGIGRSLGDAFAWFFYQFDPGLLAKHAARPAIGRMPIGVGGQGELQLARGLPALDKHLVLHHAITSILRLGDLSVWDPKAQRIVGIAEAKSVRVDSHTINVRVDYILRGDASIALGDRTDSPLDPLPAAIEERRARQVREMGRALADTLKAPDIATGYNVLTHAKDLEEAVRRTHEGTMTFQEAGPGLMFAVYRGVAFDADQVLTDGPSKLLVTRAIELMRKDSKLNSLVLGSLAYRRDSSPVHMLGTPPLFWWQELSDTVVADILFHRVVVLTLFNPAHLLEELKLEGFEVEVVRFPWQYQVRKSAATKRVELKRFEYFLELRALAAYSHESVLAFIRNSTDQIFAKGLSAPTRVNLVLDHRIVRDSLPDH